MTTAVVGEADGELTRVTFTYHGSGPIEEISVQSMEFYGMRGRDLILRKIRSQIKSSYSFEVHFNKEKIYLRKLHERPFCMNLFLLHEFVLFLPPHKLHCFMPSIYNCCAACTKYYSNKNEGYDTQNQQIYSSKGGPNVMERLRKSMRDAFLGQFE